MCIHEADHSGACCNFWAEKWPMDWTLTLTVLITFLLFFFSLFFLFSGRSVTLAGSEAVWTGVWQCAADAVLFNPVQCGERYSVSRSGCPLRHHQLPSLQISPASGAKNRRGSPLQVSLSLSLSSTFECIKQWTCSSILTASLFFRNYLEVEIALSADQISKYVDKTQLYINSTLKELRRLFLVQDLVDSIKVKTDINISLNFNDSIAICIKGALTNFALIVDTTAVFLLTPIGMDEVLHKFQLQMPW